MWAGQMRNVFGLLRDVRACGWAVWSGGGRGEGDFHAGVEPFDVTDLVAGLAVGVEPVVVAGAQVVELDGGVGDEQVGDFEDGAGGGDDGFLLAAAAAIRR